MWDLETLKRLNDQEVARRRRRMQSEILEGAIAQSWGAVAGDKVDSKPAPDTVAGDECRGAGGHGDPGVAKCMQPGSPGV
jgi:hypothetical protein